jgi:hypothetical protein
MLMISYWISIWDSSTGLFHSFGDKFEIKDSVDLAGKSTCKGKGILPQIHMSMWTRLFCKFGNYFLLQQ